MTRHAIAILSGGLDSTTLVYHLLNENYFVDCVSFDYGQRHVKELTYATNICRQLGLNHDIVDLSGLTRLISNSALTSPPLIDLPEDPAIEGLAGNHWTSEERKIEVPDGHYAEETMKQTVVPNRNMIMFAIAAGIAVNRKANTVAAGMHGGDHFVYPDCRPQFIFAAGQAILVANEGFHNFVSGSIEDMRSVLETQDRLDLYEAAKGMGFTKTAHPITTPFLEWTKADIAYRALELGVPFHMTWSCYKGGGWHCGRCGTCVERLEAIHEACERMVKEDREVEIRGSELHIDGNKVDQTEYEDTEFWRRAVAVAKVRAK